MQHGATVISGAVTLLVLSASSSTAHIIQPFFSSLGALPPVGLPAIDCFLSFLPPRSNSKWPALPARVFSVTACRPAVCFLWMVFARTSEAFLGLMTLLPVWMRCDLFCDRILSVSLSKYVCCGFLFF